MNPAWKGNFIAEKGIGQHHHSLGTRLERTDRKRDSEFLSE